ncbi:MAG: glycosyltransferase family 9 protein [Candidatus Moranbacteria bacterium]|nr:glycosyltransferase family 9 protein [Candidatus Moranbacteria bacterium]
MFWNVISSFFGRCIYYLKKYFSLFLLAKEELQFNGFRGLIFALRRHLKKKRGELVVGYPIANNYIAGRITIVIFHDGKSKDIFSLIEFLFRASHGRDIEVVVGVKARSLSVFSGLYSLKRKYHSLKIAYLGRKSSSSKGRNNLVRMCSTGEYLVFINDKLKPECNNWISFLVDPLMDKRVGITGGKIVDISEAMLSTGYGFEKLFGHFLVSEPVNQVVPVISFDFAAIRHDVYSRFRLSEVFSCDSFVMSADFCFRLSSAGFVSVYVPMAVGAFGEKENFTEICNSDRLLFANRWGKYINSLLQKDLLRIAYDSKAYDGAIIVVRDDGMGDLLMGIASFFKLRKKHRYRKIVLFTYERNIGMMSGFGIFDEILPIPNGKKYSPLPLPTCGTTIFDFVDMEMQFGKTFAETKEDNKVHRHLVFTKYMGLDDEYVSVPMPEYREAKARVHSLVSDCGGKEGDRYIVLNLIASNPARSWWEGYYEPLIAAVERLGFVPIIVGTTGSRHFVGKRVINLIGKTKSIEEYIEAVKCGSYVISTDTSACHVAGLSDIPFLAIFTGGVPVSARLGYYKRYEAVEPTGLACFPCWDEGCKDLSLRHKREACRLMITPQMVVNKLEILVGRYI